MVINLMFFLLFFYSFSNLLIAKGYLWFVQNIFIFSRMLILENIGAKNIKYLSLIFYLFIFLLISNLLGMVPYSFTITGQFIFTFAIALIFFFGITLIGFMIHRERFFGLFLPEGSPVVILPALVLIELISYIARVFSLSIRLFANMMAGHTLLNILAWFCWGMLLVGGLWFNIAFFPLIIIFLVTGLEMAIAFLQAYVFSILICIYLNDSINLH